MSLDSVNTTPGGIRYSVGGEAFSHIMAALSVVEKVEGPLTEEDKEIALKYLDSWILSLGSLAYIPGMVDLLSQSVKRPITEIFNYVSEEELGEVLHLIALLKMEGIVEIIDVNEIELRVRRILNGLGVSDSELEKAISDEPPGKIERLASALAIALIISLVSGDLWKARSP